MAQTSTSTATRETEDVEDESRVGTGSRDDAVRTTIDGDPETDAAFQRAQDALRNHDAIKDFKYLAGFEGTNEPERNEFELLFQAKWEELTYNAIQGFPNTPRGLYPVICQDMEGEYVTAPGIEAAWPGAIPGKPEVFNQSNAITYQNKDINTYFLLMPAQISAFVQGQYMNDPAYGAQIDIGTMTWQQYIESTYMMARGVDVGVQSGMSTRSAAFAAGAGEVVERGLMAMPYHTTYDSGAPMTLTAELCRSYVPSGVSLDIHAIKRSTGFKIDNFISRELTDIGLSEFQTSVTVQVRAAEIAGEAATYTVTSTPSPSAMSSTGGGGSGY